MHDTLDSPFPPARRRPRGAVRLALVLVSLLAVPAAALQSGDPAPPLEGPALEGHDKLSLADHRGKVVYLDFWASWCGPCATALPVLDSFRKEFPADEFAIFAVNVDQNPKQAKSFLARRPVGYPSLSDPKGRFPSVFQVETMPTSFLIDRDGVIRYVHRGFRKGDVEELRKTIRELVADGR